MQRPRVRLVDILTLVAIAFVFLSFVLPAIQAAREAARRMSCSNNFKQIGLALHNYRSAYKVLPAACGGTGPTPGHDDWSNQRRLSALVAITPFVEDSPIWNSISNPFRTGVVPQPPESEDELYSKEGFYFQAMLNDRAGRDGPFQDERGDHYFPAMGPAPWRAADYPFWQLGMPTFRCPSDSNEGHVGIAALSNYAFCYGDTVAQVGMVPEGAGEEDFIQSRQRGAFVNGRQLRFREMTDGLSQTMFMAETATFSGTRRATGAVAMNINGLRHNPSLCLTTVGSSGYYSSDVQLRLTPSGKASRGGNWADGAITWSGITTILPPNSPSCDMCSGHRLEGVFSASSHHRGGCHVLMGDGAVVFISDSVDHGDATQPAVSRSKAAEQKSDSPYGVWGAMGTRAGR